MSVGKRIIEERKRMLLSQSAFAERVGVSLSSQRRYETGERSPDATYLGNLGRAGVDVGYVLEGVRSDVFGPSAWLEHDALNALAFALHIDFNDVNRVQDEIRASQAGKEDGPGAYSLIEEILSKSPRIFDPLLLTRVLEGLETHLQKAGGYMAPEKKAQATVMLYRAFKASGKFDPAMVEEAVKLAAN